MLADAVGLVGVVDGEQVQPPRVQCVRRGGEARSCRRRFTAQPDRLCWRYSAAWWQLAADVRRGSVPLAGPGRCRQGCLPRARWRPSGTAVAAHRAQQLGQPGPLLIGQLRRFGEGLLDVFGEPFGGQAAFGVEQFGIVGPAVPRQSADSGTVVRNGR